MDNGKKNAILDVLRSAVKKEIEAFNYYQKASLKAPYPETVSLLMQLAEEERKHRYFLTKEMQKIDRLMISEKSSHFIDEQRVQYPVPEHIDFQNVQTSPGLDIAAVSLPAELIGGDFLDTILFEEKDGNLLGIFLYDVMGHGLEAMHLKTMGKKFFGELRKSWEGKKANADFRTPKQIMMQLNHKLFQECQSCGRFMTAFYGVIDPSRKMFTYCSAGHEPPMLFKSNGQYSDLSETELLLGADKEVTYSDVSVSVNAGDVLVIFTDGITEANNRIGEQFEREGLVRAVRKSVAFSSREIVYHIFRELREFMHEGLITDDFTLTVIKLQ